MMQAITPASPFIVSVNQPLAGSRAKSTQVHAAARLPENRAVGLTRARGSRLLFFMLHVVLPFLLGSAIYLLWRSKTTLMFSWLRFVCLYTPIVALRAECASVRRLIPDVILYSVPDGLWLYSFTALMGLIWFNEPRRSIRAFWILLPVLLAVGSEFAQRLSLIPGTFDWWDVVSYIAASIPAVVSIHVMLARVAKAKPEQPLRKHFP